MKKPTKPKSQTKATTAYLKQQMELGKVLSGKKIFDQAGISGKETRRK